MSEKLSRKDFLEAVEHHLAKCSVNELREILRQMAYQVPPSERQVFLEQIGAGAISSPAPQAAWENLLEAIDDLEDELQEMLDSADEWENEYGWQDEYAEDSLGPYTDLLEPFISLFERTSLTFDQGKIDLAIQAYDRLFELLGQEDDYGRGVSFADLSLDHQEVIARYLRAIYQTTPAKQRPPALYEAMYRFVQGEHRIPGYVPMLNDLIQIATDPLPEQDTFLRDWIAFLQSQNDPWADLWLREAVRLSEGTAGLERLARTQGHRHPRAYLDWFTALEAEGKMERVLEEAQMALQKLPADLPIRAAIADHLCIAAAALNDPESLLEGRWQALLAKPTATRLFDLWEAMPLMERRLSWMQRAVQQLEQISAHQQSVSSSPPAVFPTIDDLEQRVLPTNALLAHAHLLACDLAAAHRSVAEKQVLGWSNVSSDQALVLSWLLVLLSDQPRETLPPNLESLWMWSLQTTTSGEWTFRITTTSNLAQRADRIYAHILDWGRETGLLSLDEGEAEAYLSWCLDTAQRRVEAIVSNRRRNSYNKAANLTVACAETLYLRDEHSVASDWVKHIRKRFPRHWAFQDELNKALESTPLRTLAS